jgi:hypothetical protein
MHSYENRIQIREMALMAAALHPDVNLREADVRLVHHHRPGRLRGG